MARRTLFVAAEPLSSFPALDALTRNSDTSRRLVAHIRALNPDKNLEWCAEKAIYDIERDRMA